MTFPVFPETYIDLLPEVRAFLSEELKLYSGGQWVSAQNGQTFDTVDPSTGRWLARVPSAQAEDVDAAVRAARQAFDSGAWHIKLTASERGRLIWRLADLMDERAPILAQLDALDNGKPVKKAQTVDVPLSAEHFRYYAGWTTKIEGATIPVSTRGMFNYTVREPVGVCGLIVPWNYPLLMAAWKIAPALAAGNCIILKPAEQTPLSALYLARLFEEVGFPPGVFNVLTGFGETAGAALVAHPGVDKIGFTGSASCRADDHPQFGQHAQTGVAGTGRQESEYRVCRCGHGTGGGRRDVGDLRQQWPILHGWIALVHRTPRV